MNPRLPELLTPSPVFNEIMSGRPVVALCDPVLESEIIGAARLSGRLGDVRIVVSDVETKLSPVGKGVRFHRLPADMDGTMRTRPYVRSEWLARSPPVLDMDTLGTERDILILRKSIVTPGVRGAYQTIEDRVRAVARGEGRAEPVSFHALTRNRLEREITGPEYRTFDALGKRFMASGGSAVLERAFAGTDWSDAVDTALEGVRFLDEPDLNVVLSRDRLVVTHMRDVDDGAGGKARNFRVYEVDHAGVPWAVNCRSLPRTRAMQATIAMQVFLGGLARLDTPICQDGDRSNRISTLRLAMPSALACFKDEAGTQPDASLRRLRVALRHRVDVGLALAICRGLDPETVLAEMAGDHGTTAARRDFCITWRGLAGLILNDGISEAVSTGAETMPAVARVLGVSKPVARRLVGREAMPSLMGMTGLASPSTVIETKTYPPSVLFGAIGHDRLPAAGDRDAWAAFRTLSSSMTAIIGRTRAVTPRIPVGEVIGTMMAGGTSWVARAAALQAVAERPTDIADAADMSMALVRWLQALGIRADASLALRLVLGIGSLPRIHAASQKWHDMPELECLGGDWVNMRWPVPFDTVDLGDGWTAVALADGLALRDEGRRGTDPGGMGGLAHCVGGYTPACQTGDSLVISLRHGSGSMVRRVSTVELSPKTDGEIKLSGRPYRLKQHRAYRNKAAPPEAEARLEALFAMLARGDIPVTEESLDRRKEIETRPLNREEALELMPAWRRVLPEKVAELDADGLRAFLARMDAGLPRLDEIIPPRPPV